MAKIDPIAPTVSTPYINFSRALQIFYAGRGMWVNGHAQGWLSTVLGAQMPSKDPYGSLLFFISIEHLEDLAADIAANGRRGLSGQQVAQTLRRIREAAARAGQRLPTAGATMPTARVADEPKPGLRAVVPFEPLCVPSHGKARLAFEHHVMECLHAVVAFSQESIY